MNITFNFNEWRSGAKFQFQPHEELGHTWTIIALSDHRRASEDKNAAADTLRYPRKQNTPRRTVRYHKCLYVLAYSSFSGISVCQVGRFCPRTQTPQLTP